MHAWMDGWMDMHAHARVYACFHASQILTLDLSRTFYQTARCHVTTRVTRVNDGRLPRGKHQPWTLVVPAAHHMVTSTATSTLFTVCSGSHECLWTNETKCASIKGWEIWSSCCKSSGRCPATSLLHSELSQLYKRLSIVQPGELFGRRPLADTNPDSSRNLCSHLGLLTLWGVSCHLLTSALTKGSTSCSILILFGLSNAALTRTFANHCPSLRAVASFLVWTGIWWCLHK